LCFGSESFQACTVERTDAEPSSKSYSDFHLLIVWTVIHMGARALSLWLARQGWMQSTSRQQSVEACYLNA